MCGSIEVAGGRDNFSYYINKLCPLGSIPDGCLHLVQTNAVGGYDPTGGNDKKVSTIHCISSPRSTKSPHHFSKCRYRLFCCSGFAQTLYCFDHKVLAGWRLSKFATNQAPRITNSLVYRR